MGRLAVSGASQDGVDAGDELGDAEGFRDVVVTADRESADLVLGSIPGSEEQDGNVVAVPPHTLGDAEAVEVGQHHVEHEQVRAEVLQPLERRVAGVRRLNRETLVPQGHRHELGDRLLVVHHEHAAAISLAFGEHHPLNLPGKAVRLLRIAGEPSQILVAR